MQKRVDGKNDENKTATGGKTFELNRMAYHYSLSRIPFFTDLVTFVQILLIN